MGFRIVPKSTKKIKIGEDDWIEVRQGLSKSAFRKVLDRLPEQYDAETDFNPSQADEFTIGVFDALVVGWSAVDEDGEPIPATIDSYLNRLDRQSTSEIDLALFEHFNSLDITDSQRTKSDKDGK